jgi:hypothetical protein
LSRKGDSGNSVAGDRRSSFSERIVPVAFSRESSLLIQLNSQGEAAALGEMIHDCRGDRGKLSKTHALRQVAAIVR